MRGIRHGLQQRPVNQQLHLPIQRRRFRLLLFLFYFILTFFAIRIWILIIQTGNVYIELGGALVTVLVIACLYVQYRRMRYDFAYNGNILNEAGVDTDDERLNLRLHFAQIERRVNGSIESTQSVLESNRPVGLTPAQLATFKTVMYSSGDESTKNVGSSKNTQRDSEENLSELFYGKRTDLRLTQADENGHETNDKVNDPSALPLEEQTSVQQSSTVDRNCSICLDDYSNGDLLTELPCSHTYHQACLFEWLAAHQCCPLCKISFEHITASGESNFVTGMSAIDSSSPSLILTESQLPEDSEDVMMPQAMNNV